MKEIFCSNCGEPINTGYAINPVVSAICGPCYDEKTANLDPEDL